MKVVSDSLKNALDKPTTQRKGRILVGGNYYDVYNVEYYADCYDDGNVIGNAIASQLDFDLPYMPRFDTFQYFDGVWTGNEYEYVDFGTFNVFDEKDQDEFNKHITAFDNLIKFNAPFIAKKDYPKTLYDELVNICEQAGVELENTSITNGNFIIENNQFVNGEILKEVLKNICGVSGTYAIIKENKLNLILKNQTSTIIRKNQHKPIEWKRKTYGINQVILGMADVEGEYVLKQDDEDIARNGVHKLVVNDNYFAYTQEKRLELIDGLFEQVRGFGYIPYEMIGEWFNYLDIGDIINLDDNETIVLRINGKSPKSVESAMSAPAIIDSAIEYINNTSDIKNLIKRTELKVDKANQKITGTVEDVNSLKSSISYFSVDLSQYTLTIPTDSSKKPLETRNYDINFYGYFKGKQVVPSVTVDNSNSGITTSTTSTYIRFSVDMNNIITNLTNNYILTFTYNSPDGVYKLTKGVTVTLSTQGKDGTSVNILGSYNSLEELKQAHPTGNVGDAYIVQGDMYVWSVEDNTWIDVGDIQGPPGTNGKDGENGKSSYQIWLEQGNTGSEQDYLNSLKGKDGKDGEDGVDGYTPIKGIDYFDGKDGTNGKDGKDGTPAYFYVRYSANANGNPMTTTPQSDTEYMGTANTTSPTPPTSYSAYTWVKIKGKDGIDGVDGTNGTPGQDGENGLTPYLHIKYSEDGITFTPADDEYALGEKPSAWFGQYVDYSEADSNDFDDYEWYKFTEDIDPKLEELQDGINDANESINNTNLEVVQLKTDVTQDRESFRVSVEQLTQTIDTNNANVQNNLDNINNTLANGVETLKNTLVTININGISVATNVSKISTLITNNTFAITSSGTNLAYFGYDEENGTSKAEMDNLTIHNYFTAGYHRTEKFEINGEKRSGVFYVGGDE